MTRRLTTERLAALQEHCAEQAASRIAAEGTGTPTACPFLDLAAAVAEVLETRALIRELADYYEALAPVIRSGDRDRIDAMLELGRKVGR